MQPRGHKLGSKAFRVRDVRGQLVGPFWIGILEHGLDEEVGNIVGHAAMLDPALDEVGAVDQSSQFGDRVPAQPAGKGLRRFEAAVESVPQAAVQAANRDHRILGKIPARQRAAHRLNAPWVCRLVDALRRRRDGVRADRSHPRCPSASRNGPSGQRFREHQRSAGPSDPVASSARALPESGAIGSPTRICSSRQPPGAETNARACSSASSRGIPSASSSLSRMP